MAIIRSTDEIILNLIELYKQSLPDMDTKVGTVARDLFIDAPSVEIAKLYDELADISNKQSLRLVGGSDLDKLAKNFGIVRRQASASSGMALLTFNDLSATISVNNNAIVTASNNFTFSITSGASISPNNANFYKSVASKYRQQLDFVGISDIYAIELTAVATAPGSIGNISRYSLNSTGIPGISNVTNINAFVGGSDVENDTAFRNRVLSSFSGSSVGTALGYLNSALSITGVSDALIIEPGDPLMTRDGTVTKTNNDGSLTIVSEGAGGKVDIIIMGSNLTTITDSYVYIDKSNNNDPTNLKNDVILGQIAGDENKTINKKRIDNIKQSTLPTQPVENIVNINGSLSGSNFRPKSIDSYGRVSGNFELVKDTGVFGGSPWGFDRIHWISNYISLHEEDTIKGQFNGQDSTIFSGILEIPKVTQNILITNENSEILQDHSFVKLLHTPATNVTKVVNANTGERYIVLDQNPDKTGLYNETGRIKISGNTLPTSSDTLQVDYNWIVQYDQYSDYDGLNNTNNSRFVNDSIDWGYASLIHDEQVIFDKDTSGDYFIGTTSHMIDTILSVNEFSKIDGAVYMMSSGPYVNRLCITLSNLENQIDSISSVTLKNSNIELYSTPQNNGAIINQAVVVGVDIMYNSTIILPTDTSAILADSASVIFNNTDVYSSGNGSSNNNKITISSAVISSTSNNIFLSVSYLASTIEMISSAITSLPVNRSGNGFFNSGSFNYSQVNISRRESATIKKNLSADYYIDLSLPVLDTSLSIMSVIRISDGALLWSDDNIGTINDSGTNYQIILNGFGTPVEDQKVLVIYYATDLKKFQPFSYSNTIIKNNVSVVTSTTSGDKVVNLSNFTSESSIDFDIVENITNEVIISNSDGILSASGDFTSSYNFTAIPDITNKKIRLKNSNNSGIYDIISYNSSLNTLNINNDLSNINNQQVSIIRLVDGKEIYFGNLDIQNNIAYVDNANFGDLVYIIIFNYSNLRKAPTRLMCTTTDQTINNGVISIQGTTITKSIDIIFTAVNNGLKINLTEAIKKSLGLQSSNSIPSNLSIGKILKLEKVSVVSPNSNEVFSSLSTYDVNNSKIKENLLYDDMILDSTLSKFEVLLPSTSNNNLNVPKIGDKFRVSFYYTISNDIENLSYVKNGTLYTNKKFALIDRIYVSSGFKNSQSTKLNISSLTQPSLGSRYKIFYNYTAPKQNERISIKYTYNKLISDTTLEIENTRPINADVIVKGANKVLVDLTLNIVIGDNYKTSTKSIVQSVKDKLISDMTFDTLNTLIDGVSLVNTAQSVVGVSRARILYLNRTGAQGQLTVVQAQKNEYLVPNNIIVNVETR